MNNTNNNNSNAQNLASVSLNAIQHTFNEAECKLIKKRKDCVVYETLNHVYKVRAFSKTDYKYDFFEIVQRAFVKEYVALGLDWSVNVTQTSTIIYNIEKRQKLKLASEAGLTPSEALAESVKIKNKVERQLEFPNIMYELRQYDTFAPVDKVTLARDCDINLSDYAVFDNTVIALGNSNLFLALANPKDDWITRLHIKVVPISFSFGSFFFTEYKTFDRGFTIASNTFAGANKWWLFNQNKIDLKNLEDYYNNEMSEAHQTNVHILASKQATPVKAGRDFYTFQKLAELKKLEN